MIVALPKGVTNALTTTLRQKKSEARVQRHPSSVKGTKHIPSFSRILGELRAMPCQVSPRLSKAEAKKALIVHHADELSLQRVDTNEDSQEEQKLYPLDQFRLLAAPEGRNAGLGLTGPSFAPPTEED